MGDEKAGAEAQTRTGDTCIFSAVLYRLSYLSRLVIVGLGARLGQGETPAPVLREGNQDVARSSSTTSVARSLSIALMDTLETPGSEDRRSWKSSNSPKPEPFTSICIL